MSGIDNLGNDLDDEYEAKSERLRLAVIQDVHLDFDGNDRIKYGTMTLQMVGHGGTQINVHLASNVFNVNSGRLDLPEKGSLAIVTFLPYDQAVAIHIIPQDKFLRDYIVDGTLPQLQEGEHAIWATVEDEPTKGAFWFLRQCPKIIKQTIGKLLDATKSAIQIDNKDIHYQLEHEEGFKVTMDADGNYYFTVPSGSKFYINEAGSSATDDNALVTKKFLSNFYQTHTHPVVSVGSPTGPPVLFPSPTLPDGVSTPDVRAKNT